jgi:PAS domain S-box-containing protein
MTLFKEEPMVVIILSIIIAILLLTTGFFYRSFMQLKKTLQISKKGSSFYEDVFNAIPIPLFYKKDSIESGNKAFNHAFGPYKKELFERVQTLPKNNEQSIELTYDNHIKKQSLILSAPLHDAHNTILGFSGAIWDIHAWNKGKETLLIQKERLELALEGSLEGLFDWDMEKDTFFYSPRWKQIMGYEAHDTPTSLSSWLNLVHPKDMAHVNETLARHLNENENAFFVEHRIRDTEPLIWVAVRARVIFGNNAKALRMTGTIRDISMRKKDEEKLRVYKDLFVSFVDHLPTLAYIKDAQGRFIYINNFFQKFLGFKSWQAKNAYELFDVLTADTMSECDRLSLYEGKIIQDLNIPTEEGTVAPFHMHTFLIENEEGQKLLCGVGINKSFKE